MVVSATYGSGLRKFRFANPEIRRGNSWALNCGASREATRQDGKWGGTCYGALQQWDRSRLRASLAKGLTTGVCENASGRLSVVRKLFIEG
jgi:hypothetical protein